MRFASDNIRIVPVAEEHATGLQQCLAAVHAELGEQAFVAAPRPDDTLGWIQHSLFTSDPHFIALTDEQVIGWCDVRRQGEAGRGNVGLLGVGVLRDWRQRSVGSRLLQAALAAARQAGFTSIELEVSPTNTSALRFYERMGFTCQPPPSTSGLIHGQRLL